MFEFKAILALAAAALLAPGAAAAGERSKGEKTVPVTKNGRIPLGLEVGPIRFLELLVQKVPTDPAAIAARPPEQAVEPGVVAVASHRGEDEASMHLMVTFLDEQGKAVLTCVAGSEQDEQTVAETHAICRAERTTMGDWARITQVRFVAKVEED
jgi:hypothetical protein